MNQRKKRVGRLFASLFAVALTAAVLTAPAFAAEGGFSETVRFVWEEHSTEVFSALALLGSVLVAVLYKTGLLPLLKKALSAIGSTAKNTALKTEELARVLEEKEEALAQTLLPVGDKVEAMEKHLERAETSATEMVSRLEALELREAANRRLLEGQIAMLHGLAMGANLPKFRRDAIDRAYLALTAGVALSGEVAPGEAPVTEEGGKTE